MGGYGSTRWDYWHEKQETTDAYFIATPGMSRAISNLSRGITAKEIRPYVDPGNADYAVYRRDGWREFRLFWLPRYMGGYELYLLCPRCSRRCKTLYIKGYSPGVLACRKCHKITYASCQSTLRPSHRRGLFAAFDAAIQLDNLSTKVQCTYHQLGRCKPGSIRWRKLTARMERFGLRIEALGRIAELGSMAEQPCPHDKDTLAELSEPDLDSLLPSIDLSDMSEIDLESLLASL